MKKIRLYILLTLAAIGLSVSAFAQDKAISALTPLPTVSGTEMIPVAKSGFNYKMTSAQLYSYIGGSCWNLTGNALSGGGILGSTTAQSFSVITNNSTRLEFLGNGKVIPHTTWYSTDGNTSISMPNRTLYGRWNLDSGLIFTPSGPTTALWQNSATGSGYYVGFGNNKDLSVATIFSRSKYDPTGILHTVTDGTNTTESDVSSSYFDNYSYLNSAPSIYGELSGSPTWANIAFNNGSPFSITPNTASIGYAASNSQNGLIFGTSGKMQFESTYSLTPGATYDATTAGYVTTNQTQYSLLHRAAGDARWLSTSYSVAPTAVTAPITLTSNTLSLTSTGTGSVVLSGGASIGTATLTSPVISGASMSTTTLTAPVLGTPTSGTLTNCTGLPVAGTLLSVSAPLTLSTNTLAVTTIGSGSVALQGAVTSYTPTWTSAGTPPAIGNGTYTAVYKKTGNKVDVWIHIATGSTTTFGSANIWSFSLPTTAANMYYIVGEAQGFNSGVAFYAGTCVGASTTTFNVYTSGNGNGWLSTNPGTWGGAGTTYMNFHVTYLE